MFEKIGKLPKFITSWIKEFLREDKVITEHRKDSLAKTQNIIAIIIAIGFAAMSIPNIVEGSYFMLITTVGSAVVMLFGIILGKILESTVPVRASIYIILMVLFTIYIYMGGNEGFASMWILIACYLDTYFIDFKVGFLINLYYLVLLICTFSGWVPGFNADAYTETFLMRFPLFYAINMAFATFFIISVRKYQYMLITSEGKFKDMSLMDVNTGIKNRNGYIEFTKTFDGEGISSLCYVYIDANGLHEINNGKGHEEGDRFLKSIADYCKEEFPQQKYFRLGGDEFLVICTDLGEADVLAGIRKVRSRLAENGWRIAVGIDKKDFDFNLESLLKVSNRRMLEDKAAFYATPNSDRRQRSR